MPEVGVAVRLEHVVHDHPPAVRALDGVDLSIGAGEAVAIVGHNGCGKSTLARLLVGLERPTRGRVLLDGRDTRPMRVAQLAARVGLCLQDPGEQVFSSTVAAEVAFGPRSLGRSPAEVRRAVSRALAWTSLEDATAQNPFDLGAARRRLLALAAVLAMETPVVVLDEPTGGLDARAVERVETILAALRGERRTLVLISHDLRLVADHASRVVVLREGRVTADGSPAAVFAADAWRTLRATGLEPPLAARAGARLGLGSTPRDADVVRALARGRDGPAEGAAAT
jgi:energy-coupling factor transporter ATP-binding protein EcfA2